MFRLRSDNVLDGAVRAAALAAGLIALLIVVFLLVESAPALRAVGVGRFLTDDAWRPSAGRIEGRFDLTPMLIGSLAATIGAVALATPLGLLSAAFVVFVAPPRIAGLYRRVIELLAGVPSVVYGFWGVTVLAPLIRMWRPPGQSLLAGVLILTIMILPTIALLSETALRSAPRASIRGAAALGLSRWAMIRGVVLPTARGGIFAGVLLATGRAIGETMAVLMVAGNVVQTPSSVFDPVRTLTANIALELGYAVDIHRSALFVSGLALMVIISALVLTAGRFDPERRDA